MKYILLILALISTPVFADEMKVIGDFHVPGVSWERLYWLELQSNEYGKIQCVVRNGTGRGGVSCNWPQEKPTIIKDLQSK